MVSTIRSLGVLMIVMMTLACNKELSVDSTGGTGNNNNQTSSFRMKINGTQWEADQASSASLLLGFTDIAGLSKTNKLLSITLSDTVAKTYQLTPTSLDYAVLSDSADATAGDFTTNDGADETQSGGTVVVTSVDRVKKTISGTFQFKLYRAGDKKQLVITEGVFDKLPYSANLPPANSTDTLKAKINSADWSATSISGVSSQGLITLIGTDASVTQAVSLAFTSTIQPGTYSIDNQTVAGTYLASVTNPFQSTSGSLTILEHNTTTKRIRGNFSFTARDLTTGTQTVQITQGYFSLTYQ